MPIKFYEINPRFYSVFANYTDIDFISTLSKVNLHKHIFGAILNKFSCLKQKMRSNTNLDRKVRFCRLQEMDCEIARVN